MAADGNCGNRMKTVRETGWCEWTLENGVTEKRMKITWMGTNTLLFEAAGQRILFDPFVELTGASNPNTLDDFLDEKIIFITHGHFDHLFFVPTLLEEGDPTVFCTKTPAETIAKNTDFTDSVVLIRPGMEIPIGNVRVKAYQGRHIVFDRKLIGETLNPVRILKYIRNIPFLLYANQSFKENGETLCYELKAEGKRVLIPGSLALDDDENYPQSADLLILPYQGNNDLLAYADRVIGRLMPKRILLSHFDNAFPPVSRDVDTRPLRKMMKEKYPGSQVVKPTAGKPVHL